MQKANTKKHAPESPAKANPKRKLTRAEKKQIAEDELVSAQKQVGVCQRCRIGSEEGRKRRWTVEAGRRK